MVPLSITYLCLLYLPVDLLMVNTSFSEEACGELQLSHSHLGKKNITQAEHKALSNSAVWCFDYFTPDTSAHVKKSIREAFRHPQERKIDQNVETGRGFEDLTKREDQRCSIKTE